MFKRLESDKDNVFFRCVEDSSEAIMITDVDGLLVYVNPAWSKVYGFSLDEALGKSPKLLHSGHQDDEFYRRMWEQIRDPAIGHWKGELINKAKDGTLVPVLLTITGYRSQDLGDISGFMGIAVDLTAQKELESKIAHQDRLASVGMLASGLAHEIGTPLGVIRGRAELIEMHESDPELKSSVRIITSEIDRISKLIRSLLRVSRSFSDVHIDDVLVANVIQEVLALVGQNLRDEHIAVQIDIPAGLKVRADFSRMQQVLLNLIMNSIHAVRKAQVLGRTEGHFLKFSHDLDEGKVRICVEDSGCGIPPENMKKLFRPFFTTKDIGEGTGLGLAIVSQLVREMAGQISVQSKVGVGTVFSVELLEA